MLSIRRRSLLAIACVATLSAAQARAAEETVYPFGETITVVGDRIRLADEIATVETVTAEEIERRGARNLEEAIALLPGVYVRQGADGVPRVDIRGLRTRNIILLQDGVPLNSTYDGQFDPAALPVENIASIRVVKGTSSVLYGPGGNAGIIEITTRAGGETTRGSAWFETQTPEAWLARGGISGKVGGVGVSLAGSSYDRKSFDLPDDFEPTDLQPTQERVNSDREDRSLQGNLVFGERGRGLGITLAYREGEYGKPPTTVSNRDSDYANRARYERAEFDLFSAQAAGDIALGESATLRPTLFFNRGSELTNGYDDAGYDSQDKSGAFSEDATTEILGGGLLATMSLGERVLLSLSANGREESWDANGFNVVTVTSGLSLIHI
jgi:outer membrane receptor protein involved in Fe transport